MWKEGMGKRIRSRMRKMEEEDDEEEESVWCVVCGVWSVCVPALFFESCSAAPLSTADLAISEIDT